MRQHPGGHAAWKAEFVQLCVLTDSLCTISSASNCFDGWSQSDASLARQSDNSTRFIVHVCVCLSVIPTERIVRVSRRTQLGTADCAYRSACTRGAMHPNETITEVHVCD